MLTKNGKLQKSEDNGLSWTEIKTLEGDADAGRVKFADAEKGIAFTDKTVYITADGGETWNKTEILPAELNPLKTDAPKWNDAVWQGDRIIIVGDNGLAYKSDDSGWTFVKYDIDGDGTDGFGAVYCNINAGTNNILAHYGDFYYKQDKESISSYGAGIYDVEKDEWTPLASMGYVSDDNATSPWGFSGNGKYTVGGVSVKNSVVNKMSTHAFVCEGTDNIIDLGSKFDDLNRATVAKAVSDDGNVVVGFQDIWGPRYAAVWTRDGMGGYTQRLMLKDPNMTEDDVDFSSQDDMMAKLVGCARAVSADGKWIGGDGNDSYYALKGPWIWNEETGYQLIFEGSGAVADFSSDGSKCIGWEGIGSSAWLWTKENGKQLISDYVENVLGVDLGNFYIQSVYDMSPNGRYITGYGLTSENVEKSYIIDLEAKGTSIGDKITAQTKVAVYPNPVADILHVDMPYGSDEVSTTLTLTDTQGRTVQRISNAQAAASFDVSGLTDGIYILDVNASGSRKAFKVIVRH